LPLIVVGLYRLDTANKDGYMPNVPSKLCAHTGRVTSARKKLGAHINVPFKSDFAHSYTSLLIQMSSGEMLHNRNFKRTQTFKN